MVARQELHAGKIEAGRLLTFSVFRMGARINTVVNDPRIYIV